MCRGLSLKRASALPWNFPPESHQVLIGTGWGKKTVNTMKHSQSLFHNKGLSSGKNMLEQQSTILKIYQGRGREFLYTPAPPMAEQISLMISPKRKKQSTGDMASKKYIRNRNLYVKRFIFFKIITEMKVLMLLHFHGTAQDLTSNLHTKSGRELRAPC